MRTSGGRSFSMRMKYSVSPSFDSPSTSFSAMRYEPSFDDHQVGRQHLVVSVERDAGPSPIVSWPRATGLSVVIVSSTFVPAGA